MGVKDMNGMIPIYCFVTPDVKLLVKKCIGT